MTVGELIHELERFRKDLPVGHWEIFGKRSKAYFGPMLSPGAHVVEIDQAFPVEKYLLLSSEEKKEII